MRSSWIPQSFFDAIARWWYVLLIGPVVGLLLAFATDIPILHIPFLKVEIIEGPPSEIEGAQIKIIQDWKEKLLFTTLGVLFAGFIVYLLEDIKKHLRNRP